MDIIKGDSHVRSPSLRGLCPHCLPNMCLIHFQTFFVRTARLVWPHLGDTYFLNDKLLEIPDQYLMGLLNGYKE